MRFGRAQFLALAVMLLCVSGCGGDDTPPLGEVSGTITLDGEPLEGVIVVFKPESGRAATGTTDASGQYTLEFSYQVPGCKVGANKVHLEWPLGATNAKVLPSRYTTTSELTADVKSGENTLDFKLESDAATKGKKQVIPD
ncbi:MAG: carboxypeptidase regulatory-like domain-containing protein [Planctomycetaceae bacterium]|nr:carboxypeptidase regulatory-like domain-containing protein [Planctomycetaceae bacterium]